MKLPLSVLYFSVGILLLGFLSNNAIEKSTKSVSSTELGSVSESTEAPGLFDFNKNQIQTADSKNEKIINTVDFTPERVTEEYTVYEFDIKQGVIGKNRAEENDMSFDNVFITKIEKSNTTSNQWTLEYELYGADNSGQISYSINGFQINPTEHLSSSKNSWSPQKEIINAEILNEGINTLLFTISPDSDQSYQVRNLKLYPNILNENSSEISFHGSKNNDLQELNFSEITTENGFVLEAQNISFTFPESDSKALDNVHLYRLSPEQMAATSLELTNTTPGEGAIRMYPFTRFEKPAQIAMTYDPALIPEGYTPEDIKTFYFDRMKKEWVALPKDSVNTETHTIFSKTQEGEDFISGVLKLPESPETAGFTPTTMSDIKAADPNLGITSVSVPTANNRGSAATSFPIKLPGGRHGMAPSLGVQYNSQGGNSWMGQGWDCSLPSITIDTRWGAPRYDPDFETETYTMQGMQLTPFAHRNENYEDRNEVGDKQFFPLKESGAYAKIMRKGNDPTNYYWVVQDKSGGTTYYGGDESGIIENAVLRDANCNIGQWALVKQIDSFDNNVLYTYFKDNDGGLGANNGQYLYPDEIRYTGKGNEVGNYNVKFVTESGRPDVSISARLGYKEVMSKRLARIEINYGTQRIRSYEFEYENGAFNKTLLKSITEKDKNGEEFYTNTFNYYDEVRDTSGAYHIFGPEENFNTPSDDLDEPFSVFPGYEGKYSVISGTKTNSESGNFRIGVGFSTDIKKYKSRTVGMHGGGGQSNSRTQTLLQDMDGDNLPDKVYIENGQVKYRKNLSAEGQNGFGDEVVIPDISSLGFSKASTFNIGVDANFALGEEGGGVQIGAGYDHQWSNTKTDRYFIDKNGDGLVDFVDNTKVYFGYIDDAGTPRFDLSSAVTPSPVSSNNELSTNLYTPPSQEEIDALYQQNPLNDIVRLWRAPRAGSIVINSQARLIEDTSAERQNYKTNTGAEKSDGVLLIGYKNGVPLDGFIHDFAWDSYNPMYLNHETSVNEGDLIMFRVNSKVDGNYDEVEWNPTINYINNQLGEDYNGYNLDQYNAETDYISNFYSAIPISGNVQYQAKIHIQKQELTEDLKLRLVKINGSYSDFEELGSEILAANDVIDQEFIQTFTLQETSDVMWILETQGRINWNEVDVSSSSISNGNSTYFLPYKMTLFENAATQVLDQTIPAIEANSVHINVTPVITNIPGQINTGQLRVVAKQNNQVLASTTCTLIGGILQNGGCEQLSFNPSSGGEPIYVELIAINASEDFIDLQQSATANFIFDLADGTSEDTGAIDFNTLYYDGVSELGLGYRGWGAFGLNGNRAALNFIDLDELHPSGDYDTEPYADVEPEPGDGQYNLDQQYFFNASYNAADLEVLLNSVELDTYINGAIMKSSRLGENDLLQYYEAPAYGSGSWALNIESRSTSNSASGDIGGSFGGNDAFSAGGSATKSLNSDNFVDIRMQDFNGDRYPDYVIQNKIQLTTPTGDISSDITGFSTGQISWNQADSWGVSINGGFSHAKGSYTVANNLLTKTFIPKSIGDSYDAMYHMGMSGGIEENEDESIYAYTDINSDGLPDQLLDNGEVRLNTGYGFLPSENWGFDALTTGQSSGFSFNGSGGISNQLSNSKKQGSFTFGANYTRTNSRAIDNLLDINGDGILDFVNFQDNNYMIALNNGNGFSNISQPAYYPNGKALESVSVNLGGSFNYSAEILLPPNVPVVRLVLSAGFGLSNGVSRTENAFEDINGDGYVDFIQSDDENNLKVRYSKNGKTNLLESIETPLGSTMTLQYERSKNTYEDPYSRWELREVEVFDGHAGDGADYSKNSFEYEGGNYDRYQRQFMGYAKVTTHQLDTENNDEIYRSVVEEFYNDDLYRADTSYHSYTVDSEGNKYAETFTQFVYMQYGLSTEVPVSEFSSMFYHEPLFIGVKEKTSNFYEGQPNIQISQREVFGYDNQGNVIEYKDYGTGATNDLVTAQIGYETSINPYIVNANSIEVYTEEGLKRRKTAVFDQQTGAVTSISQYLENGEAATFNFEYDTYGNLVKNTGPKNYKDQRFFNQITYDEQEHMFPLVVTNAFEYSSSAKYDYLFQTPISSTDMNGETIRYTLDAKGRPLSILGPNEQEIGQDYTLKFEYHPLAATPYAKTYHYNPDYPDSDILTYTFTDGVGRALQVKKTISEFTGADQEDVLKLQVSGKVIYDAFGRATTSYYPITEALSQGPVYNPNLSTITPTTTTYDVLDRTIQTTLPDGTQMTQSYGVETYAGLPTMVVEATDPLGLKSKSFTDAKGRTLAVTQISPSDGTILTQYFYNALGELLTVRDQEGAETVSTYDNLGRRVKVVHPDAGEVRLEYDLASNVLKRSTPKIREELNEEAAIVYEYDYNRLEQVLYPQNVQNNVHYYYGDNNAEHKRVGRLWLQEDASGGREFFYGTMGVMEKEIRTIAVNDATILTYVSEFEYDTWNKIQSMTYPDGEKVTYSYNKAGGLTAMEGEKEGTTYSYIKQIGYDEYEQKVYTKQGNDTETNYAYDPTMRRLQNLAVDTPTRQIMNNSYSYDAVSNITYITNSATAPSGMGLLGGAADHTYEYDGFYRLKGAIGHYEGQSTTASYALSMEYDLSNKITKKRLSHTLNDVQVPETNYALDYQYDASTGPVHAVKSITQTDVIGQAVQQIMNFEYDGNGNLVYQTAGEDYSQYRWDEDNHLMAVSVNGKVSIYTYDASGERVVKSSSTNQNLFVDGAPVANLQHEEDYKAYVSPYLVVEKGKFTKHYFVGSQRVTSKIGTGSFENNTAVENGITAGNINFSDREALRQRWINEWLASLGIPPGPPNAQGSYVDEYPQIPMPDNTNDEPPLGWPKDPYVNPPGGVPGPPVQFGPEITSADVEGGYGFVGSNSPELNRYYYHPDHLGSTSYITNSDGEVCQHVEYIPFGESMFEEHLNSEVSPYLFNGKERDQETGFYYYGARYYDPKISLWLSVDPMVEKTMDAYGYCSNKPVMMIDPDGESPIPPRIFTINIRFGEYDYQYNTVKTIDWYSYEHSSLDRNQFIDSQIVNNSYMGESYKSNWQLMVASYTEKNYYNGRKMNDLLSVNLQFDFYKDGDNYKVNFLNAVNKYSNKDHNFSYNASGVVRPNESDNGRTGTIYALLTVANDGEPGGIDASLSVGGIVGAGFEKTKVNKAAGIFTLVLRYDYEINDQNTLVLSNETVINNEGTAALRINEGKSDKSIFSDDTIKSDEYYYNTKTD